MDARRRGGGAHPPTAVTCSLLANASTSFSVAVTRSGVGSKLPLLARSVAIRALQLQRRAPHSRGAPRSPPRPHRRRRAELVGGETFPVASVGLMGIARGVGRRVSPSHGAPRRPSWAYPGIRLSPVSVKSGANVESCLGLTTAEGRSTTGMFRRLTRRFLYLPGRLTGIYWHGGGTCDGREVPGDCGEGHVLVPSARPSCDEPLGSRSFGVSHAELGRRGGVHRALLQRVLTFANGRLDEKR